MHKLCPQPKYVPSTSSGGSTISFPFLDITQSSLLSLRNIELWLGDMETQNVTVFLFQQFPFFIEKISNDFYILIYSDTKASPCRYTDALTLYSFNVFISQLYFCNSLVYFHFL